MSKHPVFKNKYGYYAVLSLIVVGLGGMLVNDVFSAFTGFSPDRKVVASVGGQSVTVADLRAKKTEIARRLQGDSYAALEAQGFDFNAMALKELVEGRAIFRYAEEAGLRVPENTALDRVASHPYFSDRATGEFSAQIYRDFLRREGMSEARFLDEVKQAALLEAVVQNVSSDVNVPALIAAPVYRYVQEVRDTLIFKVDETNLPGFSFSATPDEMKKYYESNKEKFRTAEKRDFSYLRLSPKSVAEKIKIDEAELKRAYENEKLSRYTIPEKREVYQVIFDNQKQANETRKKLRDGAEFLSSLKSAGFKPEDSYLGFVSQEDLYGSSDEAVFALPVGKVSDAEQSSFGYAVYYVSKIIPAQAKSFEDSRAEILKDITERKSLSDLPKIVDAIDEFRAGGGSVKDAARQFGGDFKTVKNIPAEGGAETAGLPPELLRDVFTYDAGEETTFLKKDKDYYFFVTNAVSPSAIPKFSAVEEKVKAAMRREALQNALTVYAQKVQADIKNEADFKQYAAGLKTLITQEDLTRQSASFSSPDELTEAVFSTEAKTPVYRAFLKDNTPFVKFAFVVTVQKPEYSPEKQNAVATQTRLNETIKSELTEQFLTGAKNAAGVIPYPQVLKEVAERDKQ